MSKFRKLPVEIEAERITEKIEIHTREGTLVGYPGDWLITGVQGEKYPCGDEIFRATYAPSGDDKCSFCRYRRIRGDLWYCTSPDDPQEICAFEWEKQTGVQQ
ncbi:MAG: hypothetical protein WC998_09480 [Candidatus Paceibacterota bacterium]|jgi:hypothetical protein